jgi:3-oxoacyl-(acyl-carrier-protein) synthase
MNKIFIIATSTVTEADVSLARLGTRFGRMDLSSQLALLAVESLGVNFTALPPERVAICLAASAGSLSTDVEFWNGRNGAGGPSPMLFAYTLPSAAIGEIAIRHKLTGPNLCFVGDDGDVLTEAADLIRCGEADSVICIFCEVVTAGGAETIQALPVSRACAIFLQRGDTGARELTEFDRDMKSLCASFSRT